MAIEFKSDAEDAVRTLNAYGNPVRCCGGRIIMGGFICPHCDCIDPSTSCGAPTPDHKKHLREVNGGWVRK